MVNPSCAICHNKWKNETVKFFRVPSDALRRSRWSESCGVNLRISTKVCEKHFLMSDFINPPGEPGAKNTRLQPSAVPSILSAPMAEKKMPLPAKAKGKSQKFIKDRWRLWCRLCAKDDCEGNRSVFYKSEQELNDGTESAVDNNSEELDLTAAIGKYFSINIKPNEDLPKVLCTECVSLISTLVTFADSVSRVQEMFNSLHNSTINTNLDLQAICRKYGLFDVDHEDIPMKEPMQEVLYFEAEPTIILAEDKLFDHDEMTTNPLEQPLIQPDIKNVNILEEKELNEENEQEPTNGDCDETETFNEEDIDKETFNEEDIDKETFNEEDIDTMDTFERIANSDDEQCAEDFLETNQSPDEWPEMPKKRKRRRRSRRASCNEDDDERYIFHCTECPRKFQHSHYLRQHMKFSHSSEPLLELPCRQCNRICSTQEELDKHAKIHMSLHLRRDVSCPHCDTKLTSESLRRHIKYVHMDVRSFVCEECGKAMHTSTALKKHMLTHTDYAPFVCEVCKKGFKDKARLKTHLEIHDPTKHICTDCGLQLNSRATLQQHFLVHSDEKKHKCGHCGRAFKHAKALKVHLILHLGLKTFSCNFCDRTFSSASNCRGHKTKSHPKELAELEAAGGGNKFTGKPMRRKQIGVETDDPTQNICVECGLVLKSRATLYQHMVVHSDEKKHKCDYCGRAFKHARALKSHLIIHTGLKPYVCNFCGRTFANGSTCRAHKKRVHPKELAELEASGGGKTFTENIPRLKDLKALTKAAGCMTPVRKKESARFSTDDEETNFSGDEFFSNGEQTD